MSQRELSLIDEDPRILEDASVHSEHVHKEWGLRCCTPDELHPWLVTAVDHTKVGYCIVSRSLFCDEADSSWCRVKQRAGKCVLMDKGE